jgi:hypothetical protein
MFGTVNLYCPICGIRFRWGNKNATHGTYYHRHWGVVCSRACREEGEMKYARMILHKDEEAS